MAPVGEGIYFKRCQEPQISDFVDEMAHMLTDFLHFAMLILLLFLEAVILKSENKT